MDRIYCSSIKKAIIDCPILPILSIFLFDPYFSDHLEQAPDGQVCVIFIYSQLVAIP